MAKKGDDWNLEGGTLKPPVVGADTSWTGGMDLEPAVTWKEIDAALLVQCVDTVTAAGARLTLSISSASGALGVNVYYNSVGKTWYPGTEQATNEILRALIHKFSQLAGVR